MVAVVKNHLVMKVEEAQNYNKNNHKFCYVEQLWWHFTGDIRFLEQRHQQNLNISQARAGWPPWRDGISLPLSVITALNG
jgi:hypothetical protein